MPRKKKEEIKEAEIKEDLETTKSNPKEKEKKKEYANFWQRLVAFIIDAFIISMVTSLISQPFIKTDNIQKLSDETYKTIEEYQNKKIDIKTYVNRTSDISYDMAKESGLTSIITIAIAVIYYVIYQLKSNGQTLGKKIMKIKVIKQDDGELTMNDMLFREFLSNAIIFDIVILCFTLFTSKNVYFYGVGLFQGIEYLTIFISCIMILSSSTKQAIHDKLVKTEVIKVEE